MITRKELQEYAILKGLNLGSTEKDYLIDIALLSMSRHTKNNLIFKGGTCLYKFHKLNRFSEGMDFSAISVETDTLISHLLLDFERFGIKASQHKKKEPHNSILITLRIEGPLFTGKSSSYASLGIDINLKYPVILAPELLSYNSLYPEIPVIHSLCMKPEEIFAEKMRAIIIRNRARDLYDLNFLLEKGIHSTTEIIEKKLEYYNLHFDIDKVIKRLKLFEQYWKKELIGFTSVLQDFNHVKNNVRHKLMEYYR